MSIIMNFIVGVTLLFTQWYSISALDLDHGSELSQIDSEKPISLTFDYSSNSVDEISGSKEYSVIMARDFKQDKKSVARIGDVDKKLKGKLRYGDKEKADKIIYNIKSHRFDRAFKKMQNLKEDLQSTIKYIIHEVYNNNAGNLDTILQFVDSNTNISTNVAIFETLNYEMNANNLDDHLAILKLLKSFNKKVVKESSVVENDPIASKTEKLQTEFHSLASKIIVDQLQDSLMSNNSKVIFTISENIYNNYPVFFFTVIKQALEGAFDKINMTYLVELFMNHKYPSQSGYVYFSVFSALRKNKRLGQKLIVTLAFALKKVLEQNDFPDRHSKGIANNLKLGLPKSVHNIAFVDRVCIVSQPRGEYLYGAGDEFIHDEQRRTLFTWIPGGRIKQGYWYIERHPNQDTFYIKNERIYGRYKRGFEYLYASLIYRFGFCRYAFTWISGPLDDQFDWVFVPYGDQVLIRNERFNEYLYASTVDKNGADRRYVYTEELGTPKMEGYSLWSIEDCSNRS